MPQVAPNGHLILLCTTAFIAALLSTALMRRLAWRCGWVVMPRADRWHKKPTALHGGMGFFPVFVLGAVAVVVFGYKAAPSCRLAVALLLGALVLLVFGLLDDLKQFRPATKLLAQLVTASLFIYAGGVFPLSGLHGVDVLVTYFWFVGITNAVNMLDNMDGLASGVMILASATLVLLATQAYGLGAGRVLATPLGLVFVATLLGFWWHNRPPATIFMGDSGSLSTGYVLAALAVPSSLNGFLGIRTQGSLLGPVMALLIPATVLAIPIFDTTLVTLTRTWQARRPSEGGRDHSSHRLVGLGLSEPKAVWVLYALTAFGGGVAVLMQRFPAQSLPLFGLFVLMLALTGVYLGHVKVQMTEPGRVPPAWTPLVSNVLHKRHAAEVLLDTVLIVTCFYGAHLLRFEGVMFPEVTQAMMTALPLVVASCLLTFWLAGIYYGLWRLMAVADLPCYAVSVFAGTVLSLASVTLLTRFSSGYSRSAYIIFSILLFLTMVGARLSFRLFDILVRSRQQGLASADRQPVLIYGAGKAGKTLYEEALSNPQLYPYVVVGFIDDDPDRIQRRLCGVPVKHGPQWLRQRWHSIPEIWVSSRFITDAQAHDLAVRWPEKAPVRRLRFQIDTVVMQPAAGVGEGAAVNGTSKHTVAETPRLLNQKT